MNSKIEVMLAARVKAVFEAKRTVEDDTTNLVVARRNFHIAECNLELSVRVLKDAEQDLYTCVHDHFYNNGDDEPNI